MPEKIDTWENYVQYMLKNQHKLAENIINMFNQTCNQEPINDDMVQTTFWEIINHWVKIFQPNQQQYWQNVMQNEKGIKFQKATNYEIQDLCQVSVLFGCHLDFDKYIKYYQNSNKQHTINHKRPTHTEKLFKAIQNIEMLLISIANLTINPNK